MVQLASNDEDPVEDYKLTSARKMAALHIHTTKHLS